MDADGRPAGEAGAQQSAGPGRLGAVPIRLHVMRPAVAAVNS